MNLFHMLATLLQIYSFVLLARALISWIPNLDPDNPGVRILYQLTEPILEPIRRIVPPLGGMMDISLIIAWFATIVLQRMLLTFA
jgi:YggT family protein